MSFIASGVLFVGNANGFQSGTFVEQLAGRKRQVVRVAVGSLVALLLMSS